MKGGTAFLAHPAGFDSVRSIVASRAWSVLDARFALTNSGRFRLRRTAHRADASLVRPRPTAVCPNPQNIANRTALPQGEGCPVGTPGGIRFRSLNGRLKPLEQASFSLSRQQTQVASALPTAHRADASFVCHGRRGFSSARHINQKTGYPCRVTGFLMHTRRDSNPRPAA